MKKTIWYSVQNGGDGSAYPMFVDNEKLAEWDQDSLTDGWGEPCTGTLVITGDNIVVEDVLTNESYLWKLIDDSYNIEDDKIVKKFVKEFFPNGMPKFVAKMYKERHYGIYIGEELIGTAFAYPEKIANEKGLKKVQTKIDNITNNCEEDLSTTDSK